MSGRKLFSLFSTGIFLLAIGFGLSASFFGVPEKPPVQIKEKGTVLSEHVASTSPTITASPVASDSPKAFETARVVRVVDGDTIVIDGNRNVRYIGINTPETHHPTKGVECFGQEAYQKNKELVEGKTVKLEKDVSETDRYGRLLRYVYVDDMFVSFTLVRLGYAYATSYPPDVRYQDQLKIAQAQAVAENAGLWSSCK